MLSLAFVLFGCKETPDSTKSVDITGVWVLTEEGIDLNKYEFDGNNFKFYESTEDYINALGTALFFGLDIPENINDNKWSAEPMFEGTYTVDNDEISFMENGNKIGTGKLSEDALSFTTEVQKNDEKVTVTFKKI